MFRRSLFNASHPTRILSGPLFNPRYRSARTILSASGHSTTMTVNEDEIAHFSKLSEHWWDERGEFEMLHKMNPVRVQFIRDRVQRSRFDEGDTSPIGLEGLNALDVGCGGGLLSESLARLGAKTTGIDASEANIRIATAHATQDPGLTSSSRSEPPRLTYRHATTHQLVEEGRLFDLVCSLEVVEHVNSPAEFLESCASLVKPGGHLVLSTISRTPLAYFLTIFMAEKVLGMVTPGTHSYSKYVKPSELLDFFRTRVPWLPDESHEPSSHLAELRGMYYNPISRTWGLMPRGAPLSLDCNYTLWIRKPM